MCPTQVSGPAGRGLCKQKTWCVSRVRAGRCGAQNPRATKPDQNPRMRLSQFVSSISICRRTREGGCEPRSQDFPRNVASYSKWAHAQPGPRHSSWPAPGRSWPDDELSSRAACSNSRSPAKTRPSPTRATNYHHQQSSQHQRTNKLHRATVAPTAPLVTATDNAPCGRETASDRRGAAGPVRLQLWGRRSGRAQFLGRPTEEAEEVSETIVRNTYQTTPFRPAHSCLAPACYLLPPA